MAFGGVLTTRFAATAAGDPGFRNYVLLEGQTLDARVGAFDITKADSGRYTTDQTPAANETAIGATATTWGRGEAAWRAGDEFRVMIAGVPWDTDTTALAATPPNVRAVAIAVSAADLDVDFHNRGATNGTAQRIGLWYMFSGVP